MMTVKSTIKISAIICTFKRPDYLRQAVTSLCKQTLPCAEYEIVVVDNGVDSDTERVVTSSQNGEVNLRYVTEPMVGLSRARNKGLAEARGPYVAYLDDDARAEDRWLESLVESFESNSAAAIGGRVWLDWDGQKPEWIPNEQLPVYTYVDHGDQAHVLRDDEYLVGANLAFSKAALELAGGFDAKLGRQGTLLLSGEEAQVLRTLREQGLEILYEPAAVVWHSVHPARRKRGWLLRRMFWDGASQPLLDRGDEQPSRRLIFRGMCSDLRQCAGWSLRALAASIRGRKAMAWQSLLGLSQRAGRVRTQLRMLALNPN
ncbi:MAG TPA: glycosyltransferase family 2 protein [Pyrinomonadaceae bacterium]|nr:glycosyltransferase family 2 protein [Pyrinomonadaceae bacterium]